GAVNQLPTVVEMRDRRVEGMKRTTTGPELSAPCAHFDDGRQLVYGTMGGEGQPQTQAAVFLRHARLRWSLEDAIAAPRWLLGRTWGDETSALRLEPSLGDRAFVASLERAGHSVVVLDRDHDEIMGHAGALLRQPSGEIEAASDPRSDGAAAWSVPA
ncbi:MAG: gamma-glutamyltransferase, partial [Myxococcota bacterium]